jgi:hypothetical protein
VRIACSIAPARQRRDALTLTLSRGERESRLARVCPLSRKSPLPRERVG